MRKIHPRKIAIIVYSLVIAFVGLVIIYNLQNNSREDEFWKWFSNNSDKIYEIDGDEAELLNEIGNQLSKVDRNLTYQVSTKSADGKRDFEISANGIRESIPSVERVVEKAPRLHSWNIVAFRQRQKDSGFIELDGIKLSPDDIYFQEYDEGERTGLNLYIKDYDGSEKYMGAVFLNLDNVLGEYDVMTRIGTIEMYRLDEEYKKSSSPLKELPKIIDSKK